MSLGRTADDADDRIPALRARGAVSHGRRSLALLDLEVGFIDVWLPDPTLTAEYLFTNYFLNEVLRKRPYIKPEWCVIGIENAVHSEPQETNRWRFWAAIPQLDGRYLRVVTLDDKITIHNAFPDRGFQP